MRTRVALVALALLLAVGCSGDDGGSPTTTTAKPRSAASLAADGPQACGLLTSAGLQSALHRAFAEGAPATTAAYGTGCTWTTSTGEPAISVSLAVATDEELQVALGRVAQALYDQTRDAAEVDENLPIGDAAYRAGPQVVVLAHGVLLSLATTDTSAASIAGIRTLAAAAVDALPR